MDPTSPRFARLRRTRNSEEASLFSLSIFAPFSDAVFAKGELARFMEGTPVNFALNNICFFYEKCYNIHQMHQTHKHLHLAGLLILFLHLAVFAGVRGDVAQNAAVVSEKNAPSMQLLGAVAKAEKTPDTPLFRQAKRLQKRVRNLTHVTPSLSVLAKAITERKELFTKTLSGALVADGHTVTPWMITLHRYPTWIEPKFSMGSASFRIDEDRIRSHLETNGIDGLTAPTSATILSTFEDDRKVQRAETDEVAKAGYTFDAEAFASAIKESFDANATEISLAVTRTAGTIVNATGLDLGELTLLAEGRSNFAGSVPGRIANVRKGLKERVNNVLVPAGETFSFNSTLGAVTSRNGWFEALGIFNGDQLIPVTGGGICQVATTVYRAILNAGLPLGKRKAHSLYVLYYEKYGVGLDATVYHGQQDLTFVNDTGNPILIQSHFDGFEAYVTMYGTPDGRAVSLEGPYFAANAPEDLRTNSERTIKKNEIAWKQHITAPDGTVQTHTLFSRYKSIPKSIVKKYTEQTVVTVPTEKTHTAAPDEVSMAR